MSGNNGVIRVGRKGLKKFAFGEDGTPFEVDVVVAFQQWITIDEGFREASDDRSIPIAGMAEYHQAAVEFVAQLERQGSPKPPTRGPNDPHDITTAEALDFIARLREQYDEVAVFFQPRLRDEPDLPDTSAQELRFSTEAP